MRRRQRLLRLMLLGLRASGEGASLTHVWWLFLAGLAWLLAHAAQYGWWLAPALALFFALLATALFDAVYLIVPDRLLLVMLGSGALFLTRLDAMDIWIHVAAGVGAWVFLVLVALVYERLRGRSGLGAGDAKLYGIAGLWLGPIGLPSCLFAATLSALVSFAIERRGGGRMDGEYILPFGPHLALGLWLTLLFGPLEWL